jgi:MFS transporter, FHS family, glucose/mannose:H+ symporter
MASRNIEHLAPSPNRSLVVAGQLAFFPTGILTTILGPMLPILIVRWALNDTQAGNLFLVQFLAQLAGVQLSGVLLSRLGYRPAFLLGLLLMAGGTATLLLGSVWLGLASIAIYGLGVGLITPTDNLLISEISSNSGGSSGAGAVSLLNFFWGVGAVFCSLMVAWTAAHKLLPFFLGGVSLLLVLLALSMRNLPFPPAAESEHSSVAWLSLAKSPTIWIFASIFFLYPGAETAVGGWVGSYVSRLGPRGAAIASMMPAFFWTALTVGRALGTAFLHRVPERSVLRAGYAAGAAGIVLMLWGSTLSIVIAAALLTGLSFATLYPITVSRLTRRYGVGARSIGAVMFSLAAVGPAAIPWMVGVISHASGSLREGLFLPLAATLVLFVIHLFEW